MVSFSCGCCGDVVKKPKVLSHAKQCGSQCFSCIDCQVQFTLDSVQGHTQCVSEVEKYQGRWDPKKSVKSSKKPVPDSDTEDEKPKESKKRPIQHHFSDTDFSSDDEKKKPTKKGQKQPTPASKPAEPEKKKVRTPKASAAPTPKLAAAAAPASKVHRTEDNEKGKKTATSTSRSAIVVPSFELGPTEEVFGMVRDLVALHGVPGNDRKKAYRAKRKEISEKLVTDVYTKRIAKHIFNAIETHIHGEAKSDALHGVRLVEDQQLEVVVGEEKRFTA